MHRVLNILQSVLEYGLSVVFILGAINLIGAPPISSHTLMGSILGGQVALYVYMVWFAFLGLGLLYGKLRKKRKIHKNMLLYMYLTTIFTSGLAIALYGFDWVSLLDDLLIGIVSAALWLRWKFRTEYIDRSDFESDLIEIRNDDHLTPPP